MADYGMVIVGAGEAGARAAVELRSQGWSGEIVLIGKENLFPYERPPLSKGVLLSNNTPEAAFILNDDKCSKSNIRYVSNNEVVAIDRSNHSIKLGDGRQIGYERLLLATGAKVRKLQVEGANDTDLLYLRTFSDALAIRDKLQAGKHIAVIGGGFIGLEVAASAIEKECAVTVIEAGPRILMRGVPEVIARLLEARHRQAGVQFEMGASIQRIGMADGGRIITFEDGSNLHCDDIVVGIGAIPETSLAEGCGLIIDNGVSVDAMLATNDPDIFAVGDCCSFPHGLYEGQRIRLEAWRNAQDQGTHVALNMLGGHEPYQAIPWFWTDQYEQSLQITGLPDQGKVVVERDMDGKGNIFFHLNDNGTLVAACGIGQASIAKQIRIAEMLIERQMNPDPKFLQDSNVNLKQLLNF